MICGKCGSANPDDAKTCQECGEPLGAESKNKIRGKKPLVIGIVIAVVVIAIVIVIVATRCFGLLSTSKSTSVANLPATEQDLLYDHVDDFYRISEPSITSDRLAYSLYAHTLSIVDTSTNLVLGVIYPKSEKTDNDEALHATYLLGTGAISGKDDPIYIKLYYATADGKYYYSNSENASSAQLGIQSCLGISAEELLAGVEIYTADGFQPADPELVSDGLDAVSTQEQVQTMSIDSTSASEPASPFWGVWTCITKNKSDADSEVARLNKEGYDQACVVLTTDWSELGTIRNYRVSTGTYASQDEAENVLEKIQDDHPDATVEYTGTRL